MSDEQLDLLNWDGLPLPKPEPVFKQEFLGQFVSELDAVDERDKTLKQWAKAYLEFADSFGPGPPKQGEVRRVLDYLEEMKMQANLLFPGTDARQDFSLWVSKLRRHNRRHPNHRKPS